MAVYTEDFAGALADLTSPWVQGRSVANAVLQRDGSGHGQSKIINTDCVATYNNTIGNDQYSQIVPQWNGTGGGTNYIYLFVRAPVSSQWFDNATAFYMFWSDGGSDTQILWTTNAGAGTNPIDSANGFTYTAGDVIKLEVVGTTLKVYKNGTPITWTTSGTTSVTDSHVASGVPGFGLFDSNIATRQVDNWEGGDIAGPVVCPSLFAGVGQLQKGQTTFANRARVLQGLQFFAPQDITFVPPPTVGIYNQFPLFTPQAQDALNRGKQRAVTANMITWLASQDQGLPPPVPDTYQPPPLPTSNWDSIERGKNRALFSEFLTWNAGGTVIGVTVEHVYTQPIQVSPLYSQRQYQANLRAVELHLFHIDTTFSTAQVQPDTYQLEVQGQRSIGAAQLRQQTQAKLANSLLWRTPQDVTVLGNIPDTYSQPTQGMGFVNIANRVYAIRSGQLNGLSWQRSRDESIFTPTPSPYVPDIVGVRSIGEALRLFKQRSIQQNSQLWWNYPFASVPPATPAPVLSITATSTQLILSWPAVLGAVRYRVYKGLKPGQEQFNHQQPLFGLPSSGTQFSTDVNVQKGITYFYYVTAVNVLESVPSNEVYAVLVATTSVEADVNGLALNREKMEWYTCSRCGWYYPRKDMTIQNGLYLCTGPNTRNCKDLPGHSANFIDLSVPYEERPEPLPNEDVDL